MSKPSKGNLPKSPFPPCLAFFLDNPLRKLIIDREAFLRRMGVKKGDVVLELGCGPGFFTETLSAIVGEEGRVYAQDVEKAMLEKVDKKVQRLGLKNVAALLCNSSSLELLDGSCDVAFCANVFEEIDEESEFEGSVKEIDRILKREGIIIVKEHRFGGTKRVMDRIKEVFSSPGYTRDLEEKTFFSYHLRLLKSVPKINMLRKNHFCTSGKLFVDMPM